MNLRKKIITSVAQILTIDSATVTSDTRLTDGPLDDLERRVPELGPIDRGFQGRTVGDLLREKGIAF